MIFPFSAVVCKLCDLQAQKTLLTMPGVHLMQDTVLSLYSILVQRQENYWAQTS